MIINYACYQTGSDWRSQPAATLAAAIVQPAALRSMNLMKLFQASIANGADYAEFKTIWQYSEYVQRVEAALTNGDLAGATALLAVCPVTFGPATLRAIGTVLAANTLRLVDVVTAEQSTLGAPVAAPETVVAKDVSEALEAAGYAWTGDEWARA